MLCVPRSPLTEAFLTSVSPTVFTDSFIFRFLPTQPTKSRVAVWIQLHLNQWSPKTLRIKSPFEHFFCGARMYIIVPLNLKIS
jgi:hypothetical protein